MESGKDVEKGGDDAGDAQDGNNTEGGGRGVAREEGEVDAKEETLEEAGPAPTAEASLPYPSHSLHWRLGWCHLAAGLRTKTSQGQGRTALMPATWPMP